MDLSEDTTIVEEVSRNPNHPRKGSIIKVFPITSLKDIEKIKKHVKNNPRHFALFVLGVNTNLRASDLVRIKAGQVRNLQPMDELVLREKKTKKVRRINMNSACVDAIQKLLASQQFKDKDLIFPIRANYIHELVRTWTRKCKIEGHFGSHSLRKTWCYIQYFHFKVPIAVLMEMLNHASERQTLSYIGVRSEHIAATYANKI